MHVLAIAIVMPKWILSIALKSMASLFYDDIIYFLNYVPHSCATF